MSTPAAETKIADILEACDLLSERLEQYQEQVRSEQRSAEESGDERYQFRVQRGFDWSQELIDVMDDVYERVGALRHNHNQLTWARDGKMV